MQNFDGKYITRIILIFLLLSNLFTFNSLSDDNYKKNNKNDNLVIESAAIQEINLSGQKTNKVQFQKPVKSLSPENFERNSFSAKYKNFIKIPVQHVSLLNFQFFLSSQFSTDT